MRNDLGDDVALFLDFDGTLVDIAAKPELVVVPDGLPETLVKLSQRLDGALSIVTGRGLGIIRGFLPIDGLVVAAEHGALIDPPDQVSPSLPTPSEGWRAAFDAFARDHHGALAEHKDHGLVLHFRLAPEAADEARELATSLVTQASDDFRVVPAHAAVEIRPKNADKGRAVTSLMQRAPFKGRKPVFIGDDVTDEDGIAACVALGGYGLRIPDDFGGEPAQLRDWLGRCSAR